MSQSTEWHELVRARLKASADIKLQMLADPACVETIHTIASQAIKTYRQDGKVILCGNGGSAADSQHIAAELVGKYYLKRDPLPAMSLTVNTSSLTAVGNDFSFDDVFIKQMQAMGQRGDLAIGISTSGGSENVIRAMRVAREKGLVTVAMTGASGGRLKSEVDICLCVPSDDTPRIQEGHITAGHIVCEIVEKALFG